MKVSDAIQRAHELRNDTLGEEQKAKWLYDLDCQFAEHLNVPEPEFTWPQKDAELLIPAPHDMVYVYYLVAMVDYYMAETQLYANDMQVYLTARDEALAHHIRHNPQAPDKNWSVM